VYASEQAKRVDFASSQTELHTVGVGPGIPVPVGRVNGTVVVDAAGEEVWSAFRRRVLGSLEG
jgi:hypothetical protein